MKNLILILFLLLSPSLTLAVTEIDSKNFKTAVGDPIEAGETVVVKLYTKWCGACTVYKPEFEKAEKNLKGKARFVQIDVDKYPVPGVEVVPTTLIFVRKKGILYTSHNNAEALTLFIEVLMANNDE